MTRRLVATLTGATAGWEAALGGWPPRVLEAAATPVGRLPIPPDGPALAAADLAGALDRLERNEPGQTDAVAIGRHLLACLFADSDWAQLLAGGEDVDLVVATAAAARELDRLPWELLHDGERFLATRSSPAVTIRRSVGAPEEERAPVHVRPSVLVVVGGALDEADLQPAAEYLALLDTLRVGRLAVDAALVVKARPADVEAACRALRPDVVHVIAHGDPGTVVLAPPRPGDKPARLDADQLVTVLEAGGQPPRILVLTACRTGASPGGSASAFTWQPSLAAACVARGVPMVAAMTGAVASRACREFTFGFYSSLFSGGDAVAAAAAGRRAAFVAGEPPARTVDWAFPAVFCGPRFDGRVTITASAVLGRRATRARQLLERFHSPPTFCGRQEMLDVFRRLLEPTSASSPAVLALCVPDDVAAVMRVGASRALAKLGASAALAGHAVGYLAPDPGDDRAVAFKTLAGRLVYAADVGATAVGAEAPALTQLQLLAAGNMPGLHPELRKLLQLASAAPDSDKAVGLALRLDLAAIGRAVATATDGQGRLVVLVDDLHAYGPAVAPLLRETVGIHGLGTAETGVPLVFAYGEVDDTTGSGAVEAVRTFVQTGPVVRVEVRPFAPPAAWLAYQQLLLGADEPLVPVPERREAVLEFLHAVSKGNPDQFDKDSVLSAIAAFRAVDALVPATDAQRLAQLTGRAGP